MHTVRLAAQDLHDKQNRFIQNDEIDYSFHWHKDCKTIRRRSIMLQRYTHTGLFVFPFAGSPETTNRRMAT